jgi:hypothetical protein
MNSPRIAIVLDQRPAKGETARSSRGFLMFGVWSVGFVSGELLGSAI